MVEFANKKLSTDDSCHGVQNVFTITQAPVHTLQSQWCGWFITGGENSGRRFDIIRGVSGVRIIRDFFSVSKSVV